MSCDAMDGWMDQEGRRSGVSRIFVGWMGVVDISCNYGSTESNSGLQHKSGGGTLYQS